MNILLKPEEAFLLRVVGTKYQPYLSTSVAHPTTLNRQPTLGNLPGVIPRHTLGLTLAV